MEEEEEEEEEEERKKERKWIIYMTFRFKIFLQYIYINK